MNQETWSQAPSCIKICFLATVLFFVTLFIFSYSEKDFRFFDDDYGAVYVGKIKQTSDLKSFFTCENQNESSILPTNQKLHFKQNPVLATFRPLVLCWYALVLKFLDPLKPRVFFYLSIFLHAIAGAFFFTLLAAYFPLIESFLASSVFLFFPGTARFIGRFVIQGYSLSVILFLLSLFLLRLYLKSRSNFLLISSYLLFLATLLFHEINLGLIAGYGAMIYLDADRQKKGISREDVFVWLGYVATILFYMFWRKQVFCFNQGFFLAEFINKLPYRFYNLVTLVTDLLGLSWLGTGYKIWKLAAIFFAGLFAAFVFYFSNFWVFLSSSAVIGVSIWASILSGHQLRFLYFCFPVVLTSVLFICENITSEYAKNIFKNMFFCWGLFLIFTGARSIFVDLTILQNKFVLTDDAYKSFVKNYPDLQSRPICFVALPFYYFPISGAAQAIWLYRGTDQVPIYYDWLHAIHKDLSPESLPNIGDWAINVNPNSGHLQLAVTERSDYYIWLINAFEHPNKYSLGQIIDSFSVSKKCKSIHLKIDKKWLADELVFVTWDFAQKALVPVKLV